MCDEPEFITWNLIHKFQMSIDIITIPLSIYSIYYLIFEATTIMSSFRYNLIAMQVNMIFKEIIKAVKLITSYHPNSNNMEKNASLLSPYYEIFKWFKMPIKKFSYSECFLMLLLIFYVTR